MRAPTWLMDDDLDFLSEVLWPSDLNDGEDSSNWPTGLAQRDGRKSVALAPSLFLLSLLLAFFSFFQVERRFTLSVHFTKWKVVKLTYPIGTLRVLRNLPSIPRIQIQRSSRVYQESNICIFFIWINLKRETLDSLYVWFDFIESIRIDICHSSQDQIELIVVF